MPATKYYEYFFDEDKMKTYLHGTEPPGLDVVTIVQAHPHNFV